MKLEEYNKITYKINNYAAQIKFDAAKKYVNTNNPHKIGDIIKDDKGSMEIEKMQYTTNYDTDEPCAVFFGIELDEDLKPKQLSDERLLKIKREGRGRPIWQYDIIQH